MNDTVNQSRRGWLRGTESWSRCGRDALEHAVQQSRTFRHGCVAPTQLSGSNWRPPPWVPMRPKRRLENTGRLQSLRGKLTAVIELRRYIKSAVPDCTAAVPVCCTADVPRLYLGQRRGHEHLMYRDVPLLYRCCTSCTAAELCSNYAVPSAVSCTSCTS